jgi:hypothetical protein
METMMQDIKRIVDRPWQIIAAILMAVSLYNLIPEHPSLMEWFWYGLGFFAFLTHGLDNYRDGMERGLEIMRKMEY